MEIFTKPDEMAKRNICRLPRGSIWYLELAERMRGRDLYVDLDTDDVFAREPNGSYKQLIL